MSVATERPEAEAVERAPGPWRKVLRRVGWTFIGLGIVLILFVVYELFGTNLVTARHQSALRDDLEQQFAAAEAGDRAASLRPIPGEAVGIIRIPAIELNMAFVEGVSAADLKKGPGHYAGTPLPGEEGNVGIAAHRTTYARPFWALDKLKPGDLVYLRTVEGSLVYEVVWQKVVTPDQHEVLGPTAQPSLTLTTCNPRFSASERLIVRAHLVREVAA
ncbi:MAG TPA: class E sortase [Actinomycetota bacterium]